MRVCYQQGLPRLVFRQHFIEFLNFLFKFFVLVNKGHKGLVGNFGKYFSLQRWPYTNVVIFVPFPKESLPKKRPYFGYCPKMTVTSPPPSILNNLEVTFLYMLLEHHQPPTRHGYGLLDTLKCGSKISIS